MFRSFLSFCGLTNSTSVQTCTTCGLSTKKLDWQPENQTQTNSSVLGSSPAPPGHAGLGGLELVATRPWVDRDLGGLRGSAKKKSFGLGRKQQHSTNSAIPLPIVSHPNIPRVFRQVDGVIPSKGKNPPNLHITDLRMLSKTSPDGHGAHGPDFYRRPPRPGESTKQ